MPNAANLDWDNTEGNVGYLTAEEFDRLRRAVHNASTHMAWWRVAGYVRMGSDPDEERGRGSRGTMPLGLPPTWLAAEEISQLSSELNKWRELEDAANDLQGVEICTLLTKEVETACAKWPMSERARSVRYFRCTACQMLTLRYYPPTFAGERLIDSAVKCTNKECRAVIDEQMFARMALLIEAEQKEKDERVRRLGTSSRSSRKVRQIEGDDLPVGA